MRCFFATVKACRKINTRNRIILSGTPIQNNLLELWALFDYVGFGQILGRIKDFKEEFANAIESSTCSPSPLIAQCGKERLVYLTATMPGRHSGIVA